MDQMCDLFMSSNPNTDVHPSVYTRDVYGLAAGNEAQLL